ncbi:hypothetical protein O6H91_11G106600 [Diphasiastrum complanatum]|uniref:Uncharacterized protein n=1 Tax=Diphasiastrum complanatum TaxID=34168 RepID=A0ACC2CCM1_DIPCM|nr:hypothetical protein O6H91_11G106600 [Diphasiastrum complanatum]
MGHHQHHQVDKPRNERKEPHVGRHSERLRNRGQIRKWFEAGGTLESALVPLAGLKKPKRHSQIQGHDFIDLETDEKLQVKPIFCGLNRGTPRKQNCIASDLNLDQNCSHIIVVDTCTGLSVEKRKRRGQNVNIYAVHHERKFEDLTVSEVPRKSRSHFVRKRVKYAWFPGAQAPGKSTLQRETAIVNTAEDCLCAVQSHIPKDAAPQSKQLRAFGVEKEMAYCPNELGNTLNRVMPIEGMTVFAQGNSVLSGDGYNFPEAPLSFFKQLKMHGSTLFHPDGSHAPMPDLQLSAGRTAENSNLIIDLCMSRDENLSAVMVRNHSATTKTQVHANPEARESGSFLTSREYSNCENFASNQISEFANWLSYPTTHMLVQNGIKCQASKERSPNRWDPLYHSRMAACSRICPQAVQTTGDYFHQRADPPVSGAALEITGTSDHIKQNQSMSMDDMTGVCSNTQPFREPAPSGLDICRLGDWLMDQPSGYIPQMARSDLWTEEPRSNLHTQIPPQNHNWKETPSERLALNHPCTQSSPVNLYWSGTEVIEGIQQVSTYSNGGPHPQCGTPSVLTTSASVDPQPKSLRKHSQGKGEPLFDLNEIPNKDFKTKPKKHRPRVARDKPPRATRTPKKSNAKKSNLEPKPQNGESGGVYFNYNSPPKDYREQPGQTSGSPRNSYASNALLNSMNQQATSMHCNMASGLPQSPYPKEVHSTHGFLELAENRLLIKENSTFNLPLSHISGLQAMASRGQPLSNHVNVLTADSTVKSLRKKRGVDAGNQRMPSKSKRKVQGSSTLPLNVQEASQQRAYLSSGTILNTSVPYGQEGHFNDHWTARVCMEQAYESNSNFICTGFKRKMLNGVPVNAGYEEPSTRIHANSCIHTTNASSPCPLPSVAASLQIPKCINSHKQRNHKGQPKSSQTLTNKNSTQTPQEIKVFTSELSSTELSSSGTSHDVIENLIHCFRLLYLDEAKPLHASNCLEIVQYSNPGRSIVPYEGPFNPLRRKKLRPKVMLDMESNRMWKLLMGKESDNQHDAENQDDIQRKWVEKRMAMKTKVDSFISRMHVVQGDRRFSKWKGSVVDSVVGAFLTQNVSDHLSSSAFMALAAKFPINKEPAVNDTEVSTYEDYTQHGANTYELGERNLSEECRNQERNVIAVDCLNMASHGKSECSPPVYGLEDGRSPSKERDYRFTPESSESIVREFSPSDKQCNAESPMYPTPLQSVECYRSVSYAYDKEKSNLLHQEREDASFTPFEGSTKSNSYKCRTEKTSGTVRRQLFKEFMSTLQGIEDNASCITGSSVQNLEVAERTLAEKRADIQQLKFTANSSIHFCQMKNCSSTIEMASKEGNFQDKNNTGSIASVSSHIGNQLTEDEQFDSDQTGYVGSCTSFNCPSQEYIHDSVCGNVEAENLYLERAACDGILMKENESLATSDDPSLSFQEVPCCQALANFEEQNASNHSQLATSSKTVTTNESDAAIQVVQKLPSAKLSGIERAKLEQSQGGSKKIFDWESLRQKCETVENHGDDSTQESIENDASVQDGIDWEAIRLADVKDVADVIKERGMNNILAGRIKAFLERLHVDHGNINLEWLRKIPVDDAKNFLLSVRGLGLKSVECIRLLTLRHLAFPVDTNVGRICVRLGWVPIEPLPEELQLHLLELYPVQATIQKYLWPRLCTLDQRTLYELHYQMITFGKVFCTKSRPNCNACPMKGDCKHFSSAFSSAKLALPAAEPKESKEESEILALPATEQKDWKDIARLALLPPEQKAVRENAPTLALTAPDDERFSERMNTFSAQILNAVQNFRKICEPIIEEPASPEPYDLENFSTLTEQPLSPNSDDNYIVIADQSALELPRGNKGNNLHLQQIGTSTSKALILMPPDCPTIPVPKLKNVGRLRTVHYVYELPDDHELLAQMDAREVDDPCFYLLAIWNPGESLESPPGLNHYPEVNSSTVGCDSTAASEETVKGTLLVPCRTAMRGSFPLNGTYFQVNEVFADHESSLNPIEVPRSLLWSLQRRFVYFGTSIPSIFRGLTRDEIKACFWEGYVCVRGFERLQRAPRPLAARLHFPASKRVVSKKKVPSDGEDKPL